MSEFGVGCLRREQPGCRAPRREDFGTRMRGHMVEQQREVCDRYSVLLFRRCLRMCQSLDTGPGLCPVHSLAGRVWRVDRKPGPGQSRVLGPCGAWPHRVIWNFPEPSRGARMPQEADRLPFSVCHLRPRTLGKHGGGFSTPLPHTASLPVRYPSSRSGFPELP